MINLQEKIYKLKQLVIDSIPEVVKDRYYKTIPYNYRPEEIWYQIKCFLFKRYSTVRVKSLPHTWCDRCDLLPHMMFQILSDFIEKECSPGNTDWIATNNTIKINNIEVNVREEMQALYDWWHKKYLKAYPNIQKDIWAKINEECEPTQLFQLNAKDNYYYYNPKFEKTKKLTSKQQANLYNFRVDNINRMEERTYEELNEKLHRLVNIIPYMWT